MSVTSEKAVNTTTQTSPDFLISAPIVWWMWMVTMQSKISKPDPGVEPGTSRDRDVCSNRLS